MSAFTDLPPGESDWLLVVFRIVFGFGMVSSLVLAVVAIRRRAFGRHRGWMMQAYAIGLGAGTRALLFIPLLPIFGKQLGLSRTLIMGAGWALNLTVAEWLIRMERDVPACERFGPL